MQGIDVAATYRLEPQLDGSRYPHLGAKFAVELGDALEAHYGRRHVDVSRRISGDVTSIEVRLWDVPADTHNVLAAAVAAADEAAGVTSVLLRTHTEQARTRASSRRRRRLNGPVSRLRRTTRPR